MCKGGGGGILKKNSSQRSLNTEIYLGTKISNRIVDLNEIIRVLFTFYSYFPRIARIRSVESICLLSNTDRAYAMNVHAITV